MSPQEKLSEDEKKEQALADAWPDADPEFNGRYASHYDLIGWLTPLSTADLAHNSLKSAHLLDRKNFPFMNKVNPATVSL